MRELVLLTTAAIAFRTIRGLERYHLSNPYGVRISREYQSRFTSHQETKDTCLTAARNVNES